MESFDVEKLKQEILTEIKKELQKTKMDIIDSKSHMLDILPLGYGVHHVYDLRDVYIIQNLCLFSSSSMNDS